MTGPSADIHFICGAHASGVSTITLNEGVWAYCPGGDGGPASGHVWIAIPAARLSELKGKQIGHVRERWKSEPASRERRLVGAR